MLIKNNPRKGFWATSFAAFMISPFLTNDGVCLLFVEPILSSFAELPDDADALDESYEIGRLVEQRIRERASTINFKRARECQ